MTARLQYRQSQRFAYLPVGILSSKVEYAYYLAMLYGFMKDFFGGPGILTTVMMLGIAGFCLVQLRTYARAVYAPIALLIGFVITLLAVQVVIHDISILDESLRPFILWSIQLIIVHSLCLRRGFSFRFPLFLFFVGLTILPFIDLDLDRARSDMDVFGAFPVYFGFFTVYFAILGLETKRSVYRTGAWLLAVGCLFVVALGVGRGPLLGLALAITVGFRGLLKRGFVPALMLVILVGIVYETGLFEQVTKKYEERITQETGRERLFPAAIERIFSSPIVTLFGVGEPNVSMYVLQARVANPPHNAFLRLALSSGVVPFAFFLAFWIQAAWRSMHAKGEEGDAFRAPFLVYTFVLSNLSDLPFIESWAVISLSVAAGSAIVHAKRRILGVRVGNEIRFGLFPEPKSREPRTLARPQL